MERIGALSQSTQFLARGEFGPSFHLLAASQKIKLGLRHGLDHLRDQITDIGPDAGGPHHSDIYGDFLQNEPRERNLAQSSIKILER